MTDPFTVVVPTRGDLLALQRIADHIAPAASGQLLVIVNHGTASHRHAWPEVLRRLPDLRVAFCPGGGVSRVRNLALRIAAGDDLVFIDDDVVPTPSALERLIGSLGELDVGVTTGRVVPIPADGSELYELFIGLDRGIRPRTFGRESLDDITPTTSWLLGVGAAFAVRRSILDGVDVPPVFDESLSNGRVCGGAEDVDFFLQCLHAGVRLAYCPEAEFRHAFPRSRQAGSAKMRQYARADGAFYGKWHVARTRGSVGADLADWAQRLRQHVRRQTAGEPHLPVLPLAEEPLHKAAGAAWWHLFASR